MFGGSKTKPAEPSQDKTHKVKIVESYFGVCTSKCLTDVTRALGDEEKVCLAKCLDRAYEYLMLATNKSR